MPAQESSLAELNHCCLRMEDASFAKKSIKAIYSEKEKKKDEIEVCRFG